MYNKMMPIPEPHLHHNLINIFLAGGAGPHITKQLDLVFASLIPKNNKVLIIKISKEEFERPIKSRFERFYDLFRPRYRNKNSLNQLVNNPIHFLSKKLKPIVNPLWAEYDKCKNIFYHLGIKEYTNTRYP
jgi:hypothetical protein